MENLKGCGVDQDNPKYNRSIESYDYKLKYRLNGTNTLKRRQSYSDDSDKGTNCSSNFFESKNKRFRANSLNVKDRKNVRLRLGPRGGHSEDSSSNDGASAMNGPRTILDLVCTAASAIEEVAREIANKLYEEKDDLLCEYQHFEPFECFIASFLNWIFFSSRSQCESWISSVRTCLFDCTKKRRRSRATVACLL